MGEHFARLPPHEQARLRALGFDEDQLEDIARSYPTEEAAAEARRVNATVARERAKQRLLELSAVADRALRGEWGATTRAAVERALSEGRNEFSLIAVGEIVKEAQRRSRKAARERRSARKERRA